MSDQLILVIEKIYIEEGVCRLPFTRKILKTLPRSIPRRIFQGSAQLFSPPWLPQTDDVPAAGKKILVLARQRGRWLLPCPCTPNYLGCGYWVLDVGIGCPFDCSYCFLQFYQNNPYLTVYTNLDDLAREIKDTIGRQPRRHFRIGSGEFTDSLALEKCVPLARELIKIFARYPNVTFEFKTKSATIGSLLKAAGPKRQTSSRHKTGLPGDIVVGWSVNPPEIIKREERGAPHLSARLNAAGRCRKAGYRLAFHFDPIIDYPGWEKGYKEVVKKIAARFSAQDIAWISLGSLRFAPALKNIVERRFPKSRIMGGEFISGRDSKYRYPRPLRQEMYKKILGWLAEYLPGAQTYFCMESPEVWAKCHSRASGSPAIPGFPLARE